MRVLGLGRFRASATPGSHRGRDLRDPLAKTSASMVELTREHCGTRFRRHCRRPGAQRFWAGVRRSDDTDGCWEWAGVLARSHRAYNRFLTDDGRMVGVARFAYELHHGLLPAGRMVGHTCGNRGCVNPEHLFAATQHDIRLNAQHPDRRGERNHNAKLTWQKVRSIRARHASGETVPALARAYGVDPSAIRQVVLGKTWQEPSPPGGKGGPTQE
jgi:hypothetical protein